MDRKLIIAMGEKLGQHFLINTGAITKIIAGLQLQKGEGVIEIGPGAGALTKPLAELCAQLNCKLQCIEKDPELVNSLASEFVSSQNVEIISGDALIELPKLTNQLTKQLANYKVVGNIPYYITGHLLRTIGELEHKPAVTVLMIQKEVAERLTAEAGANNLLAAATQIWADAELLFKLPPKDFDPPPQVWSAVIRLTQKKSQPTLEAAKKYYDALHVIFKQPRKTLLNNLSEKVSREEACELLESLKLPEKTRPQDLSLEQIQRLAATLA